MYIIANVRISMDGLHVQSRAPVDIIITQIIYDPH